MNRPSHPALPRMPGSAILAVVFLGLKSVVGLIFGTVTASMIPPGVTALLVLGGLLNAALAIGLVMRQNWARITGMVLSGIAIGIVVIETAAAGGASGGNPASIGLSILLLFVLSHRNTRAWCVGRGPNETPLGAAGPEPFTYLDRVVLLEDIDDLGLRAGAVGTVVDLPAEPDTVLVEFGDHADREPIQVTLHVSEVRPAAEAG
ncbi:DUF4926 domain-containing protein [Glycomyces sp. NPDC049804]|uniref:DUF4926 domain-containing protein n=1 Tax=Glycomyces sp. NPDC049804 TaxID=3154363 RepID=UPI003424BB9C